ncbi:vacuolar protein sorting-associated protein 11 homolog [Crassostrea angulata]|uniref:Vacuolar protein sorting-associated protein 11 homolog n=1 Tax=Magallana gigas TaxID=29159 RepID=A0A8W8MYA7_MAGGI|nr:vacuolar protein sorting-associated protein 11 homolog [Crassostrea gigas]XP_052690623.1 vacuolar protein sorting-associated protein 11 homolog [Crassostrea angulata]|eukprot:XP_011441742.1 PREDICTED: vacuolar protein sorting-associated protein 11 homolog [Crassostrea gigas]
MAFLQWRRFNFFDKEILKDTESDQVYDKLKDVNISACVSGRGQLIVGDHEGYVYLINKQLSLNMFKAYEIRVSHLYQLKQHNLLVSIGEDEQGINPLIKVWNLDKMEKGGPLCTRISRAIPNNKATPVTCLVVHENLNWMAVGFENGSVMLFKGDVTRDRHNKSRIVHETSRPVTALEFRTQGKNIFLFVVTEASVVSINISGKQDAKNTLEQFGGKLGGVVMSDHNQDNQLVVARPDAVYFYQSDSRGPCLAFEGEKLRLHWFRNYLIVVGKEDKTLPRPVQLGGQTMEMNIVTVYDIQNKFIAYSAPFPDVIDVLSEWGCVYILGGDRKIYQLQEKDTQTKLEMLFKKNNYTLAISLAKSQQYDQEGLIDIFTQYGDHLYSKGDHDGAIDQYIKTIGKLEASYVIRKFLDAQRIHNLTKYLQALHKQQQATEEHTTLLLNCYTKLKDVNKLDEFIMTKDREVDFDVETAIRVCRQAGYFEHALFLAEKHGKHEWYLRIQLEDIKQYQRALQYISKLEFSEAEKNVKRYGKVLMAEVPQETTELLKRLCTDYRPTDKPLVDQNMYDGTVGHIEKAQAENFIHIFVNNSERLTEFLEHMIRVQPNSPSLLYNSLLELYLHDIVHETDSMKKTERVRKTEELLKNPDAKYDLDQAMVLCQMNDFKVGILYLYEKAHLYQQILRYHMEHDDYVNVIETCKKFGQQDSNLWVQALSYFARKEDDCKPQLMEVLSQIDKKNLLPPLLVIQTLAHNSTATLSVVKDYIIRRLQMENDQIAEDERLIKQYREDTDKKRAQIEELKTTAKVFQASKCNICNHPLELPSVHFLCEPHSYHQHCFESYAENDSECPVCAAENRKIMDIIRAQEQSRDLHEQFHNQLQRSQDGFSVVADYFGRGVFNKVTLITDSPARQTSKSPATSRYV